MSSDTNQATHDPMAHGEKSRSNCGHPRGFLPSMSLQRRAITLQTNSPRRLTVFLVAFFLTAIGVLFSAGAFAQQQQAPISPSKHPPPPSAPPPESSPDALPVKTQVKLDSLPAAR